MTWLRTITREIFGLFVDDGLFAVLILCWLTLSSLLLPRLHISHIWHGPILFLGLAVILAVSALRYSRRHPR